MPLSLSLYCLCPDLRCSTLLACPCLLCPALSASRDAPTRPRGWDAACRFKASQVKGGISLNLTSSGPSTLSLARVSKSRSIGSSPSFKLLACTTYLLPSAPITVHISAPSGIRGRTFGRGAYIVAPASPVRLPHPCRCSSFWALDSEPKPWDAVSRHGGMPWRPVPGFVCGETDVTSWQKARVIQDGRRSRPMPSIHYQCHGTNTSLIDRENRRPVLHRSIAYVPSYPTAPQPTGSPE